MGNSRSKVLVAFVFDKREVDSAKLWAPKVTAWRQPLVPTEKAELFFYAEGASPRQTYGCFFVAPG